MIAPIGGSPFIPPMGDNHKINPQVIKQINDQLDKMNVLESDIKNDPNNKELKKSLVDLAGEVEHNVWNAPYDSFTDGASAARASTLLKTVASDIADQPPTESIDFKGLNSTIASLKTAMTG